MSTEAVRVLLVDDHPVVRRGVSEELRRVAGVTVVGEASTGSQCLRMVDELTPDLVLLDMSLPDLDGAEVTYRLRERHPGIRVLVFSGYADDAFVFGALEAGASGYLLKDEMLGRLADAVMQLMEGQIVLSERVTEKAIRRAVNLESGAWRPEALTDREQEILKRAALFQTNDEISRELDISPKTVEYHMTKILTKLNKTSRREVARWAWESGFMKR